MTAARWRPVVGRSRGYSAIGLDNPKTAPNVGSALRAAQCFDAALVCISGTRLRGFKPTDTGKAWRHLPLQWHEDLRAAVPYDCVPVAIELVEGAVPLTGYAHPERAFYVFGPEDGTLGERVLSWCRDVVYVPAATCLNLAACVNVVLYDRLLKRDRALPAPAAPPEGAMGAKG